MTRDACVARAVLLTHGPVDELCKWKQVAEKRQSRVKIEIFVPYCTGRDRLKTVNLQNVQ